MKEFLGILAIALSFFSAVPYILDILKGKTKPHLFTYIVWTIVTTLAFLGQLTAGAGPGAWTTGAMAFLTLCILIASIKHSTKDITKLDIFFFVTSLLAIIPWLLTKDPTISVVIATFIDVCAFFPTIRKTFSDPNSETLVSWILNLIRHPLAILATTNIVLATYIYPASLFVMNAVVVYVIIRRRLVLRATSGL
jgi:hypothetical protein